MNKKFSHDYISSHTKGVEGGNIQDIGDKLKSLWKDADALMEAVDDLKRLSDNHLHKLTGKREEETPELKQILYFKVINRIDKLAKLTNAFVVEFSKLFR